MHKQICTTARDASANSEGSGEFITYTQPCQKDRFTLTQSLGVDKYYISSASSYNYVPEHELRLNSHVWPILLLQKHPGNVFSQIPAPGPPVVCC